MSIRRCRRRFFSTSPEPNSSLDQLEDKLLHLHCESPFEVRKTYASLLKLCGNTGALSQGKRVHEHISRNGLGNDGFLGDLLVQMYGKCGSLSDASSVFENLPRKTVYSWNFLISAYARNRHSQKAIELYRRMEADSIKPDSVTLLSVLGACSSSKDLEEGKKIHAKIRTREYPTSVSVETVLVKMYARCGKLQEARDVFDSIETKDVVAWNSMIAAYAQHGHFEEARRLCDEMESVAEITATDTTFAGILGSCQCLEEGKKIHSRLIARRLDASTIVRNALVSMYARCGRIDVARMVFNETELKSIVSWNAMISAYAQRGHVEEAVELFEKMDMLPNEVTYATVLGICSGATGRKIHEKIRGTVYESNVTVATSLVSMYAKSGCLEEARGVFDGMEHKNVVSWNAMLGAYVQRGSEREALDLYDEMVNEKVRPDEVTVVIALGLCATFRLLELGKEIHHLSVEYGYDSNIRVQNALVGMYGKCNELDLAREVFQGIKVQDVFSWTTLIVAYAHSGRNLEAIRTYKAMEMEGVEPDDVTLTSVLSACSAVKDLALGQAVHERVELPSDAVVAALINMYVKCGRLDLASELFRREAKTLVVWNAIISAHAQEGYSRAALDVFERMDSEGVLPDESTLSSALRACSDLKSIEDGEGIHVQVIASGTKSVVVHNALITMYATCGRLGTAKKVFNRMENRDVVSWTAMISAYVQEGEPNKAITLYKKMIQEGIRPTEVTMLGVITACSLIENLFEGILIHALSNNVFSSSDAVQAALIGMYAKCKRLDIARRVFDEVCSFESSVNCWNAILSGYTQLGFPGEAIRMYHELLFEGLKPNEGTFAGVLGACSSLGSLREGNKVHEQIFSGMYFDNMNLKTALVNMYAKCGQVEAAFHIFERMEEVDIVAWNAMIAAYAQNSHGHHALDLYEKMLSQGVEPDSYTITNILSVCSNLRLLEQGKKIHERAVSENPELGPAVECALFNLYAKCGKLDIATRIFDKMRMRNVVCWHGIIAAYAHHGYGHETLWYYREFKLQGYETLEPTYLCVFLACGHAGLVKEGLGYFHTMVEDGISPNVDHYSCMVNVFAKAGKLADAEELLHDMPFYPNSVAWTTLLGACKTHGDLKRASRAANWAMKLDKEDSAPYVLLSNTFAAS